MRCLSLPLCVQEAVRSWVFICATAVFVPFHNWTNWTNLLLITPPLNREKIASLGMCPIWVLCKVQIGHKTLAEKYSSCCRVLYVICVFFSQDAEQSTAKITTGAVKQRVRSVCFSFFGMSFLNCASGKINNAVPTFFFYYELWCRMNLACHCFFLSSDKFLNVDSQREKNQNWNFCHDNRPKTSFWSPNLAGHRSFVSSNGHGKSQSGKPILTKERWGLKSLSRVFTMILEEILGPYWQALAKGVTATLHLGGLLVNAQLLAQAHH